MRRRALLIGLALACAAACSKSATTAPVTNSTGNNNNPGPVAPGTTEPALNTVNATITDTFDPSSLTVSVGTTVSFVFGSTAHNVMFNPVTGRPDDIPGSNSNTTITRTFNTAGTFGYQCTIHAGMTGTITVQ